MEFLSQENPNKHYSLTSAPGKRRHPVEKYFGNLLIPGEIRADDRFMRETGLVADDVAKRPTLELTKIVNLLVITETAYDLLFPLVQDNEQKKKMRTLTFDNSLFERAAPGVPPRFVSWKEEEIESRQVRYAQGVFIDHDFWKTPDGVEKFTGAMITLATNAKITLNLNRIFVILQAFTRQREYMTQHGDPIASIFDNVSKELRFFGILNKEEKGIYAINSYAKSWLKKRGVNPNLLFGCPGIKAFIEVCFGKH